MATPAAPNSTLSVFGWTPAAISTLSASSVCVLSSFRFLTVTFTPFFVFSTPSVRVLTITLMPALRIALATSAATSASSSGSTWSSISTNVMSTP